MLWIADEARDPYYTIPMPNYRITVHDGGEPATGVEHHTNIHAARQSAARSAVGILLDTRKLDHPLTATVTVRDEASTSADIVRVTVAVSHMVERG